MKKGYALGKFGSLIASVLLVSLIVVPGTAYAQELLSVDSVSGEETAQTEGTTATENQPEVESDLEIPMTASVIEESDGAAVLKVAPAPEAAALFESRSVTDLAATTPTPGSYSGQVANGLDVKVEVSNTRPTVGEEVTFTYTLTNNTKLDFWWEDKAYNTPSNVISDSLCQNLMYRQKTFTSSAKHVGIKVGKSGVITCTTTFDSPGVKTNEITIKPGSLWLGGAKKADFGQVGSFPLSLTTVVSASGNPNGTQSGTLELENLPDDTNTKFDISIASEPHAAPNNTIGPVTSNDAPTSWTLEKIADKDYVKAGGEEVTYTYKVKNNTEGDLLFWGMKDDSCSPINIKSGIQPAEADGSGRDYIKPGETAEWECKSFVDTPTTGIVQAAFQNKQGVVSFAGTSTHVGVRYTSATQGNGYGIPRCEAIDFTTVGNYAEDAGALGSMYPGQHPVVSNKFPLEEAPSNPESPARKARATTASATSSQHPDWVYYSPIVVGKQGRFGDKGIGIYRINKNTGQYQQVVAAVKDKNEAFHDVPTNTNRLAFDAEGNLWSLAVNGRLYSLKLNAEGLADTGTNWVDYGFIPISGSEIKSLEGRSLRDLELGDIAFDGTGTMWVLGSSPKISIDDKIINGANEDSFLFSLNTKELSPTNQISANLVSKIRATGKYAGKKGFFGLAFGQDGAMYASFDGGEKDSNNLNNSKSVPGAMYRLNLETGEATYLFDSPYLTGVQDLSSCAFPRPRLTAEKTGLKKKEGADDLITYSINIANRGSLAVSGVTFQDTLDPDIYKLISAKENGIDIPIGDTNPYQEKTLLHTYPGVVNPNRLRNPGVLLPGDTFNVELTVKVLKGGIQRSDGKVCNQASVVVANTEIKTDDPTRSGGNDSTCLTYESAPGKIRLQKAEYNPSSPDSPIILDANLGGAEFAIYPAGDLNSIDYANPVKESITTTDAFEIQSGNYALVEKKSPKGLNLLAKPVLFKVEKGLNGLTVTSLSDSSIFSSQSDGEGVMVLTIADTRSGTLPKTGGAGVGVYALIAAALAGMGAYFARRRNRA